MTGRHSGLGWPGAIGDAAREATASPWHGKHRAVLTFPGGLMLTQEQRGALADAFMSAGIKNSDQRAEFIGTVVPGWIHGGDLGWLSCEGAEAVLAGLAARDGGHDGR